MDPIINNFLPKTIESNEFVNFLSQGNDSIKKDFKYQKKLTEKLDDFDRSFSQNWLNEVVESPESDLL